MMQMRARLSSDDHVASWTFMIIGRVVPALLHNALGVSLYRSSHHKGQDYADALRSTRPAPTVRDFFASKSTTQQRT